MQIRVDDVIGGGWGVRGREYVVGGDWGIWGGSKREERGRSSHAELEPRKATGDA